jgi:phosphate transport system substrate-binding protein
MKLKEILLAAACAVAGSAQAVDITGAGATFPYPIYAKWADAYKKATGVGLNYQSIGSGGGIKQITARTVAFGASDAPMKSEDLDKHGLLQFPAIMGGVVPVYSLKTVRRASSSFLARCWATSTSAR